MPGVIGIGGYAQGNLITNFGNLIGSNFADILTGDQNANNIQGSDGDDLIEGLAGPDGLDGGAGLDTVSYTNSLTGVNVNLATDTQTG